MPTPSDPLDPLHYVALSLLPLTWWRDAVEALRTGEPPADVLCRLVAERPQQTPGLNLAALRHRAAAGLTRAAAQRIRVVPWDQPEYPVCLTTIHDPPPVLWIAGRVAAVQGPA